MPMLRSSYSPSHLDRTTLTESDELVTVEAPTAEEAIDALSAVLGPDIDIVTAGKVARGGVGGFFAREMVQLTARRPGGVPAARTADAAAQLPARPDRPVARSARTDAGAKVSELPPLPPAMPAHLSALLAAEEADTAVTIEDVAALAAEKAAAAAPGEPTFAEALRRQLGLEGSASGNPAPAPAAPVPAVRHAAAPPAPAPPVPGAPRSPVLFVPPAAASPIHPTSIPPGSGSVELAPLAPRPVPPPAGTAAGGTGAVAWSPDELVRIGLPFSFIRPLLDADPEDDLDWIQSLAASFRPLCRPLPAGDSALVGPRAGHLAQALGLPLARPPHGFPEDGSVCLPIPDDAQSGRWFERVRGTRWTHVVAGGIDLRALAELEPMAVSWVGADVLPGALRFAVELGIPFGWFTASEESGRVLRATPIDVALAVRDLVVRR
jgi:hypothetical protein